MTRYLILNLKIIEAFTLVQGVCITGTSPLGVSNQTRLSSIANVIRAAWRWEVKVLVLARVASAILALLLVLIIAVRVVYEALLFEEVFPSGISWLGVVLLMPSCTKCIILNINLTLGSTIRCAIEPILDHAHESQQLRTLYLLRIKVVRFSNV